MIKFSIQYDDLKYIFSALKSAISGSQLKPAHQYIRFQCEEGILTAQSVDGVRIHSVSIPVTTKEKENFQFLLKPFALPKFKALLPVECELGENEIQFDFLDRKFIERLGTGIEDFIDTKAAIPMSEPVFKIGFNPHYIADAAKSLITKTAVKDTMVMEFYGPLQPAKLYNRRNRKDFRLVLPVRIKEDSKS